jgi:hypothetical protein
MRFIVRLHCGTIRCSEYVDSVNRHDKFYKNDGSSYIEAVCTRHLSNTMVLLTQRVLFGFIIDGAV